MTSQHKIERLTSYGSDILLMTMEGAEGPGCHLGDMENG